jgi:NitT/TauT family transport system ATP-binding protein
VLWQSERPVSEDRKALISLRNVKKIYRTRDTELEALGDVSFDLFPGEFVSVVGPSGCGKTTLLKILAGLLPHSAGEIVVDDRNFDIGREVGFVFQKPLLLHWRRVLENELLPIEILKIDRKSMVARARELLAQVGLEGF